MPNWCYNSVVIQAPMNVLLSENWFIEVTSENDKWPNTYMPNMHKLFPDVFTHEYKEIQIPNPYREGEMMESSTFHASWYVTYPKKHELLGDSEGWYNWNIINLWTKWIPDMYLDESDEATHITFDSAWSPANELFIKIAEFSWYELTNEYEEPGMAFRWTLSCYMDEWVMEHIDKEEEWKDTCSYCDEEVDSVEYREDLDDELMCDACYKEEKETRESNAWVDEKQNEPI